MQVQFHIESAKFRSISCRYHYSLVWYHREDFMSIRKLLSKCFCLYFCFQNNLLWPSIPKQVVVHRNRERQCTCRQHRIFCPFWLCYQLEQSNWTVSSTRNMAPCVKHTIFLRSEQDCLLYTIYDYALLFVVHPLSTCDRFLHLGYTVPVV